jgi:hypothetical protein
MFEDFFKKAISWVGGLALAIITYPKCRFLLLKVRCRLKFKIGRKGLGV